MFVCQLSSMSAADAPPGRAKQHRDRAISRDLKVWDISFSWLKVVYEKSIEGRNNTISGKIVMSTIRRRIVKKNGMM